MSAVRLPDNPCPVKTVAWVAWEVLAGRRPSTPGHPGHYFAFSVPVSREEIEVEVREEFRALTGNEFIRNEERHRIIRAAARAWLDAGGELSEEG